MRACGMWIFMNSLRCDAILIVLYADHYRFCVNYAVPRDKWHQVPIS